MRISLEVAKYTMLLILLLYSGLNVATIVGWEKSQSQERICGVLLGISLLHMTCGYLILFQTLPDSDAQLQMVLFALTQAACFVIYYSLFGLIYKSGSRILVSNVIMLTSIGMMIQTRLNINIAMRQMIFVAAGMIVTLIMPGIIRYLRFLGASRWLGLLYAVIGIGLLLVVKLTGSTTYGAQLSISIGGILIQPSEFVKISFIFMTAAFLKKETSFANVCLTTVLAAAHVLVLAWSTDLGSALVYFMAYLAMLFIATRKAIYPLLGLSFGAAAAVAMYYVFRHVRVRVAIWQDPLADYASTGYQLSNGLFGISTGGWTGLGLGQGLADTIPLAQNDMVFAVICEELGMIFAILFIIIYLLFILQMCMVSLALKEQFYKILGIGCAITLGFQALLHIGGTTKMIPLTGITLPFISQGGSSVISSMIIIGIIQGLYLTKAMEELVDERRAKESRRRQRRDAQARRRPASENPSERRERNR